MVTPLIERLCPELVSLLYSPTDQTTVMIKGNADSLQESKHCCYLAKVAAQISSPEQVLGSSRLSHLPLSAQEEMYQQVSSWPALGDAWVALVFIGIYKWLRDREDKPQARSLQFLCEGSHTERRNRTGQQHRACWEPTVGSCLRPQVSSYSSSPSESRNFLYHFPLHSNENCCNPGKKPGTRVAKIGPNVLRNSNLSPVYI